MRAKVLQSIILATVTGCFAAGCESYFGPEGTVVPNPPPPPPVEVDMTTPNPGFGYEWVNGAWNWDPEKGWYWEKGHWDVPPFIDAVWSPPHCVKRNGEYILIAGRWK